MIGQAWVMRVEDCDWLAPQNLLELGGALSHRMAVGQVISEEEGNECLADKIDRCPLLMAHECPQDER